MLDVRPPYRGTGKGAGTRCCRGGTRGRDVLPAARTAATRTPPPRSRTAIPPSPAGAHVLGHEIPPSRRLHRREVTGRAVIEAEPVVVPGGKDHVVHTRFRGQLGPGCLSVLRFCLIPLRAAKSRLARPRAATLPRPTRLTWRADPWGGRGRVGDPTYLKRKLKPAWWFSRAWRCPGWWRRGRWK